MVLAEILKESKIAISDSALMSLLSIVIVFAVLFIIIGVTELIFKFTGLLELKGKVDKKSEDVITNNKDIKDDDMMVAVLVASIDYQNETGKDVKLVSVKEIK